MKAILIDTCIWVDVLRGKPVAVSYVQSLEERPLISALAAAELVAGVKGKDEPQRLKALLHSLEVVDVDLTVAELAGQIKAEFGPSHGTCLADAVIAATAQIHKADLVTLNVKHFPMLNCVRPY